MTRLETSSLHGNNTSKITRTRSRSSTFCTRSPKAPKSLTRNSATSPTALLRPPLSSSIGLIWNAYQALKGEQVRPIKHTSTDLISLIRFGLDQDETLIPYGDLVEERYQGWLDAQQSKRGWSSRTRRCGGWSASKTRSFRALSSASMISTWRRLTGEVESMESVVNLGHRHKPSLRA